jgi:cell division protein FtsW
MFFMANSELRQIILLFILVLLVGGFIIFISENGRNRIIQYWNGLQDFSTASDHIRFSLRAIVEGGWFGKGLGKGTVKVIGLPVAWTDSIFSVIAEELGLVGAFSVLGMYVAFLWRGIRVAHRAPDQLGKLLAGGITVWIAFEAFVNISVMVNLLPFAGNPLPFISTGGSSLVTSLAAVGILLNISRQGIDHPVTERRNIATYRRGGRNRRRSVSGARSSARAQSES